jgi:hypothetical protein
MTRTIVDVQGQAALVEYDAGGGRLKRVLVPRSLVNAIDDLDMGIPYGVPWEELVQVDVTPQEIANRLRIAGIWTLEDLHRNPKVAMGALQAAYKADIQRLAALAAAYESNNSPARRDNRR